MAVVDINGMLSNPSYFWTYFFLKNFFNKSALIFWFFVSYPFSSFSCNNYYYSYCKNVFFENRFLSIFTFCEYKSAIIFTFSIYLILLAIYSTFLYSIKLSLFIFKSSERIGFGDSNFSFYISAFLGIYEFLPIINYFYFIFAD